MIKIAVCDDQEVIAKHIKQVLDLHAFMKETEVEAFVSGEELIESALKKKYDIILMDIELSDKNNQPDGMVISNKIKAFNPKTIVIFFTGTRGHETELLNFEPFRFVRKPIDLEKLFRAVEDAIKRLENLEEKYFTFRINGIMSRINIKEIIYLMSRRPYIVLISTSEEIEFREKLDDVEMRLEKTADIFVRANKSYLVNKNFIKSYTTRELTLLTGECITISPNYIEKFIKKMQK